MTYVRKRPRYTRARLAQWLHYYVFSMECLGFDFHVRHNYKNTKGGADCVRLIYKKRWIMKDISSLLENATGEVRRVEVDAGLVAHSASEPPSAVRIISTRGCEYDSSYSVELLALTAAIVARGRAREQLCSISSDCQNAIRTCIEASRGQAKAVAHTTDGYTKGLGGLEALGVRRIKAHPE